MTRPQFGSVNVGEARKLYDSSVWFTWEAPKSYWTIFAFGTPISVWAVYRILTAFSPYAKTIWWGDVIFIAFIGMFLGLLASVLIMMIIGGSISGLMKYFTGKHLHFSVPQGLGPDHDSTAGSFFFMPVLVGLAAGYACWFFGVDPSFGLMAKIGMG
jgi:RsiW-degrading membrane proteinase PrsW (M82 family)